LFAGPYNAAEAAVPGFNSGAHPAIPHFQSGSIMVFCYSHLCLNPYLSVDGPGYGVLGSMYFKSDIRKITKKNSKKSEKNIDYVFVVNEIELSARKG
jgi:hypothetical protein